MRLPLATLLIGALTVGCGHVPSIPSVPEGQSPQTSCTGVRVSPGNAPQVQRLLDGNPPGTRFCFEPGTYRFATPIVPKSGQQLIGAGAGTMLDGAKIVSGFVRSGSEFVAPGFLRGDHLSSENCIAPRSGCNTPQDVFLDGEPLRRVTSLSELVSGTFYEDFAHNRIWLRNDPVRHIVEQAYASALVQSNRGGVVITGFVVELAANPAQYGAIDAVNYTGSGWRVERNIIRYNHAAGVFLGPAGESQGGSSVAHNLISGNGQEGIAGYGSGHVISDNEITGNNRVGYSALWECGGAKFGGGNGHEVERLTVTGNNIHDNACDGFWIDINGYDITFSGNTIVDNAQRLPGRRQRIGAGILLEISDRAVVTNNDVERNGPAGTLRDQSNFYLGGQIEIAGTANVDVYDNRVIGGGGIGMLEQDRTDSCTFGRSHSPFYPDGTPVCPYRYHFLPIGARLRHELFALDARQPNPWKSHRRKRAARICGDRRVGLRYASRRRCLCRKKRKPLSRQ